MVTVCTVLFGNIVISRRFCRCIAVDPRKVEAKLDRKPEVGGIFLTYSDTKFYNRNIYNEQFSRTDSPSTVKILAKEKR